VEWEYVRLREYGRVLRTKITEIKEKKIEERKNRGEAIEEIS
jgi:hypothetical protein